MLPPILNKTLEVKTNNWEAVVNSNTYETIMRWEKACQYEETGSQRIEVNVSRRKQPETKLTTTRARAMQPHRLCSLATPVTSADFGKQVEQDERKDSQGLT